MQTKQNKEKFWEFRNAAETGGTAELLLYGDISRTSWFGDEVTPQAFAAELASIPTTDELVVRICSGGGDVWAAQAIGAMLENRVGTVTAQIEGICASAATIVACHCKTVRAAEDATYMIHPIKVSTDGFVDVNELQQLIEALNAMRTNVLNLYAKKTGETVDEVAVWMDSTSWWTAAEAQEHGFIDEIMEGNQTAKTVIEDRNGALFVNSVATAEAFENAPDFVRNRAEATPAADGFVNKNTPVNAQGTNGGNDMEFKNADELRKNCPDLVKEIENSVRADAQKAERERLAAIDEIADTIPSELVANAKYGDNACTAQELAYRAALDAKKKGNKLLEAVENDANTSGANSVGGAITEGAAGSGVNAGALTASDKKAVFKKLLHGEEA